MSVPSPATELPAPSLFPFILGLRGQRVILGVDLAQLYGVTSKRFHEQVRRNPTRFPSDFCFRLTREEVKQVAANCGHLRNLLYSRQLPLAFTEHGALMAASVLNSERAVEVSVLIVRTFVRMRSVIAGNQELADRLGELERQVIDHDETLRDLVETLRELLDPAAPAEDDRPRIGFRAEEGGVPLD